jgi:hypothetical protein
MSRALRMSAWILAVAAATMSVAAAEDTHRVLAPDMIQWQAAPPALPKGAMIAVLAGNPAKSGMYIMRVKMPADYVVPPHWHSQTETVSVLSGTFHIGMGDDLDKTNATTLPASGFVMMPSPMHHYAWSSGDTIIQISGMGPFDIHYVHPGDDPRGTTGSK